MSRRNGCNSCCNNRCGYGGRYGNCGGGFGNCGGGFGNCCGGGFGNGFGGCGGCGFGWPLWLLLFGLFW